MASRKLGRLSASVAVALWVVSLAAGEPRGALAQAPPDLTIAGQAGGWLFAQAPFAGRFGNRLYLAAGPRITVYEVSDPTAPDYIGQSEALPGFATHLAIDGTRLYAAIPAAGLFILDIGDRLNPEVVGTVPNVGFELSGLAVHGSAAFVADRKIGLQIFDVQDPKQPRLLGVREFKASPDAARPMPITRMTQSTVELLLVADDPDQTGRRALITLNAADPTLVHELGRMYFVSSAPKDMVWIGNYAYLSVTGQVLVFNLARPEAPEAGDAIAILAPGMDPTTLAGTTSRLYISLALAGVGAGTVLLEYDLADPAAPVQVARHTDGPWGALAISRQVLFSMADATVGIYNIRTTPSPVRYGTIVTVGDVLDAAAGPSHAYALTAGAIWTLPLDDPTKVVSHWETPWTGARLVSRGDKLLVAAGTDGLRVVYVADPTSPRELPGLPVGAGRVMRAVAVQDARSDVAVAIVGGADGGGPYELWTIDLTPPDGPVKLGSAQLAPGTGWSGDLGIAGPTALLASGKDLVAVDVRDPSSPREAGRTALPGDILSLTGAGSRMAYVGLNGGIRAFDVSNPAQAVETTKLDTGSASAPRGVLSLGWQNDRLYALLAFPPRAGGLHLPGFGPNGHAATLQSIRIDLDGALSVIDSLDIAAEYLTVIPWLDVPAERRVLSRRFAPTRAAQNEVVIMSAQRLIPQGRYVLVAGGMTGLTEVRRASGRGVFPDAFMPIASPAGRE